MASSTISSAGPQSTVPCTLQTCPLSMAQLPYAPNLAGNLVFLSIHSFCLVLNIILGLYYRTWGFLISMSIGCTLEILGYVGRIQMHYNPFPQNPFLLYLICVTIASVFITAAIYLCLARIVVVNGEKLSIVRPRTYTFTFITCDFVSLLLQAGGGTMVSMATDLSFSQIGVHVTEAGLSFQVASLLVFISACAHFAWRCRARPLERDERFYTLRSSKRFRLFLVSLACATILMLTRCCFRVAELSSGFKGSIWYNQVDYMALEGSPIALCVLLLTFAHPGIGFSGRYHEADFKLRIKQK